MANKKASQKPYKNAEKPCPSCSGNGCLLCSGTGFILTEDGKELVRFIRRHFCIEHVSELVGK